MLTNFYLKKSNEWDTRAGVRVSEETFDGISTEVTERNLTWHLPTYSAILEHEELQKLSNNDKEFVRGVQLLEFVTKQAIFEINCVNYVASRLSQNRYDFQVSEKLRLDALKVYTDEGYHSYYTQKVADQIRMHLNVGESDVSEHVESFFTKIEGLVTRYGIQNRDLCMLSLVIIAECQIVSDLSDQMKNTVVESIRVLFKEHMQDETYHAMFFKEVLKEIWPMLTPNQQEVMGRSFCHAMVLLGTPRTDIYYFSLSRIGMSKPAIQKCIEETYHNSEWSEEKIRNRNLGILNLLRSVGVFSVDSVRQLFEDSKLL